LTVNDLDLVANTVKRRAQIPGCHALTYFSARAKNPWLGRSTPAETRLLRALLPSLKTFGGVSWHAAFDPCFRDICPPHLEILEVEVDDGAFPSLEVLEAAPKKIGIFGANAYGATALQAVIAA